MNGPDASLPEPTRSLVETEMKGRHHDTPIEHVRPLVRGTQRRKALLAGVALVLITPRSAWAYLDPGTGSYLIQVALAALLGAMVTLRLYWKRVKEWFKGTKPSGKDAQQSAGKDEQR
jgi:hypothetical protein